MFSSFAAIPLRGVWFLCGWLTLTGDPAFGQEWDFGEKVLPILSQNCLACHNRKQPEGGLDLESHTTLMNGSDSGEAIIKGDADNSYLLQRVLDDDDPMPPTDNSVGARRLNAAEIEILRAWINNGARPPASRAESQAMAWQSLPQRVQPVNAMVASPEGSFLAYSRGNQVAVRPQTVGTGNEIWLRDPSAAIGPNPESSPPVSHRDVVQSLAVSPDGQRLATGGFRTVKIWQRYRPQLVDHDLLRPGGIRPEELPTLSRDGRYLATRLADRSVEVFDLDQGQSRRFMTVHSDVIRSLIWLGDSRTLLSCDHTGDWKTISMDNGEVVTWQGGVAIQRLAAQNDHQFLVLSEAGKLQSWKLDWDNHQVLPEGSELATEVRDFATSGSPVQWMVVVRDDGQGQVRDAAGQVAWTFATEPECQSLTISPDGQKVVLDYGIPKTLLINRDSPEQGIRLDRDAIREQQIALADRDVNRQTTLVQSLEGRIPEIEKAIEAENVVVTNLEAERNKAQEALQASEAARDKASQTVASQKEQVVMAEARVAEAMQLLNAAKTELEAKAKAESDAIAAVDSAREQLAKREQAYQTATDSAARAASQLPAWQERIASEKQRLEQLQVRQKECHDTPVPELISDSVVFTARGRLLAPDVSGRLRQFRPDGTPQVAPSAGDSLTCILSHGTEIWSATSDGHLRKWSAEASWRLEATWGGIDQTRFSDRITALAFHPDGQQLAVGSGPPSRFGDIQVVHVPDGETMIDLGEVHSDSVLCLAYSPDGRLLASGGADKIGRLFDAKSGDQLRTLEGHTHHILSLDWQEQGQQLVTGSADLSLKLWNAETGIAQHTWTQFASEITSVRFVGQTHSFLAACGDGKLWQLDASAPGTKLEFQAVDSAILSTTSATNGSIVWGGGLGGELWSWQREDGRRVPQP